MRKTIKFLKSESFVFVAIIFVTTGQILHTIHLLENLRRMDLSFMTNGTKITVFNWFHAFICAIAIESAILISILNGKKRVAQIYAMGSFATNLLYYSYWAGSIPDIISSTLMSAMLSGSIWFFSDIFAQKVMSEKWQLEEEIENTENFTEAVSKLSNAVTKMEEEGTPALKKMEKQINQSAATLEAKKGI
jgi:hypothetical protein